LLFFDLLLCSAVELFDSGCLFSVPGVRQRQMIMEYETTRSLQAFKDILVDRYGSSDFMWMSQDWRPRVANLHTFKTNPQKIKLDVLKSPRVQHVIEEVICSVSFPLSFLL
jgi:hypothetical protein